MKKIKDVLFTFVCVTTCVVFATALYVTVFWPRTQLGCQILWQILAVSFLCSLGTLVYPDREVSKKTARLLVFLHYLLVNAVVLGCGIAFEWFYMDKLPMVIGMFLLIAAVFWLVSAVMWKKAASTAALMNEQLRKYQSERQEETGEIPEKEK